MVALRNVWVRLNDREILRDITLEIDEPRVAVIGANGSGKSTFARLLNALVLPTSGEVLIGEKSTREDARRARRTVGLVFQNPEHQIVMPTVEEDLAFGLKNLGLPKAAISERIEAALAEHGISHLREQPAHLLSGGEKKLLSILSVLVMEPQLIVFDEPLTSLDLIHRQHICGLIDRLPQRVIAITHDLETIAHYDRAILLHEGRVLADGSPSTVTARYLEVIGQCSPFTSPEIRPSTLRQPA